MAQRVKRKRAGLLSPARLWLLSISLHRRGHRRLALLVKRMNALLYHNSLAVNASVAPDINFEHHAFGVMVHDNVVIGPRVSMWHHVTLTVRGHVGAPAKLIIEEDVKIGAHAIVVTPIGKDLRIGRAARIGAGAIVTHDVPAGATVVSPPARVLTHRADKRLERLDGEQDAAPAVNGSQDSEPAANGDGAERFGGVHEG
jgi:serine O-acetyltransferase